MKKKKSFVDDGWAVWITGNDDADLHINEWVSPSGKSFADIFFSVRNVITAHELNLYVPFIVEKSEIRDVSEYLRSENIFRAIFGARCIMDYMKNEYTSEVAYHGKTMDLVHFSKMDYGVKHLTQGTLITVSIDSIRDYIENDEIFIMFRLPHKNLDKIFAPQIDVRSLPNRIISSLSSPVNSEKYACSVRVNEARLLPDDINRIGLFYRGKIKKVFIRIIISEDYQISEFECYKVNRLEKELYGDFIPEAFNCEDAINYEWIQTIERNVHGNYSFYFYITKETISKISMILYMILLVMIGIIQEGSFYLVEKWFNL